MVVIDNHDNDFANVTGNLDTYVPDNGKERAMVTGSVMRITVMTMMRL